MTQKLKSVTIKHWVTRCNHSTLTVLTLILTESWWRTDRRLARVASELNFLPSTCSGKGGEVRERTWGSGCGLTWSCDFLALMEMKFWMKSSAAVRLSGDLRIL